MNFEECVKLSQTLQQRVVFQDSINDQGFLFGGIALKWMDEVAYLTASRFTNQKMVTVSVEKACFLSPVRPGKWIEISGKVTEVGNVKLLVEVEIWMHGMLEEPKMKAAVAQFIFAPLNEKGLPVRISIQNSRYE